MQIYVKHIILQSILRHLYWHHFHLWQVNLGQFILNSLWRHPWSQKLSVAVITCKKIQTANRYSTKMHLHCSWNKTNYWVCRNLVFCRRSVFCKSSVFWLSFQKASRHYLKENNSFWIWRYFAFRWRQIWRLSNSYVSLLITYFTIYVL